VLDDHEALIGQPRDPHAGGLSGYAEPHREQLGRHEPESTDPLEDRQIARCLEVRASRPLGSP
jgi:hypothetical protein